MDDATARRRPARNKLRIVQGIGLGLLFGIFGVLIARLVGKEPDREDRMVGASIGALIVIAALVVIFSAL